MTSAVEVGTSFSRERRMAWYGVRPASVRGAACTGSSPSGRGTRWRTEGTRRYSAIPPSSPSPPPPPRTGARSGRSQYVSNPSRHRAHTPQPQAPTTATGCPTSTPVTPSPRAYTQPAFSWPSVNGGDQGRRPSSKSCIRWRSEWQAPEAPTWTTTCPGAGSGTGTSSRTGSLFHAFNRSACISTLPPGAPRGAPPAPACASRVKWPRGDRQPEVGTLVPTRPFAAAGA